MHFIFFYAFKFLVYPSSLCWSLTAIDKKLPAWIGSRNESVKIQALKLIVHISLQENPGTSYCGLKLISKSKTKWNTTHQHQEEQWLASNSRLGCIPQFVNRNRYIHQLAKPKCNILPYALLTCVNQYCQLTAGHSFACSDLEWRPKSSLCPSWADGHLTFLLQRFVSNA